MEKADEPKKIKYPLGVFFVVYNGLSDRFAYYGIKAVLILYLTEMLLFQDDKAKEIYHLFFMFCTLIPVFGASIADSFVGKFKTILVFTIVYIAGNAILTAAAIPPLLLPRVEFSILGLALLAIGTGCVKPCVVALGGDQFTLPEQEKQLSSYFSVFYFAISAGALVATFLTPIFRKDVSCFGDDCYSLVFATTTTMMITALIAFLIGKSFYKTTSTDGSVIIQVTKCITHAATMKYKKGKSSTELHWLDHASSSGKFDRSLVEDIKSILKVLILYPTFPMFWALMEQQGSSWTLQASRMDGSFFGFNIKPDHIQVINPLLVLALIPAFDRFLYPALGKFNLLKKPLQKLGVGGVLAAIAFVMSAFVELHLEADQAGISHMIRNKRSESEIRDIIPHNLNQTWLSNVNNTSAAVTMVTLGNFNASSVSSGSPSFSSSSITVSKSSNIETNKTSGSFEKKDSILGQGYKNNPNNFSTAATVIEEEVEGLSKNNLSTLEFVELKDYDNGTLNALMNVTNGTGGSTENDPDLALSIQGVQTTAKIHMLWLIPQYITLTVAEVMFAVSGMEFSYSQAPSSMKSVMQSAWLVTIALGNLIVAVVAKMKFFSDQSSEFFLFAVLMLADMVVFIWLANKYAPRNGFRKPSVKPYREIVSMSLKNHETKETAGRRRHTAPAELNC